MKKRFYLSLITAMALALTACGGGGGEQQQQGGISPQEQEAMLDAIQAQEDKTQEKVKEKQGVIVRGSKNW